MYEFNWNTRVHLAQRIDKIHITFTVFDLRAIDSKQFSMQHWLTILKQLSLINKYIN